MLKVNGIGLLSRWILGWGKVLITQHLKESAFQQVILTLLHSHTMWRVITKPFCNHMDTIHIYMVTLMFRFVKSILRTINALSPIRLGKPMSAKKNLNIVQIAFDPPSPFVEHLRCLFGGKCSKSAKTTITTKFDQNMRK